MDNFSKQIYEAGINDGRAEGLAEGKAVGISEATIRFIKNIMLSVSRSVEKTTFYLLRLSYITMAYRRAIILCNFSESSLDFRCPLIYT